MTIEDYKFKIFKVYCSYIIRLSYKMNGSIRILSGLVNLFPSLEKMFVTNSTNKYGLSTNTNCTS